jgi:hypothetical protein
MAERVSAGIELAAQAVSQSPILKTFQLIDSFTTHHGASSSCSPIDGCDDG